MRKGIVFEMLGFVILAIAIIGVIIFLRTYLVGPYGRSFITVSERHELEGFKAGANSVLKTTEPRSGKTIEELIGIAAYVGNTTVDFGPGVVGSFKASKSPSPLIIHHNAENLGYDAGIVITNLLLGENVTIQINILTITMMGITFEVNSTSSFDVNIDNL